MTLYARGARQALMHSRSSKRAAPGDHHKLQRAALDALLEPLCAEPLRVGPLLPRAHGALQARGIHARGVRGV